ncbi:hypothetical protein [Loigolactobacillus jiayinensis]|uniref:DUF2798 domain-containing protein n=1 Tax=Loigolactobacillus jiayinensis TaxID=2486016 RepID=A0ABW1RB83_9LACO|nr:hypothetical protein [Loigolactobacillus jiayinensis]
MEFYQNLPRNRKEFVLFMAVISLISVNIIAPLITSFEIGFHWQTWANVLPLVPFIWLAVIVFVALTYRPAAWLTSKIVTEKDSYNAHLLTNILCTVFMMSIGLTIVGTWIGQQHISWAPLRNFFYRWPRNFALAFAVELLIAQPIARWVMRLLHRHQEVIAE